MSSLIEMIESIRSEVNDTATSHLVRQETPNGIVDSSNKIFYTAYFPVSQIVVTVDGTQLPATAYVVDADKGKIKLTTAPVTSIVVDYYFNVFVDGDITVWIDHGCKACGFNGVQNIQQIPEPLTGAVEHYAISMACDAWARKYAEGFSWTVGPESVDKKGIAAEYRAQGDQAFKTATIMRDDYYKRYGKREAPSYALKQFHIPRYDVIR